MRYRVALLLASLLCLTGTAPATAEVNLDAFLSGFDNACRRTPRFEAFRTSIIDKYGSIEGVRPGEIPPPSDVGAALGPITAVDRDNYSLISMPVTGTFRGLKLTKLGFFVGKSNGINGYFLEFDEPPARVKSTLGAAVARGKKIMKAEDRVLQSGQTTDLDFTEGVSSAFCDFSN